ncbi:AAA family ATPase [Geosporobacter ferrireducens]|uniref:Uncharacterized protein n=1 Tax=Geosporobacter ferrireducens TaxID=1424294 RepID=A0A1D8GN59_9FIRM|nr:ATP-binding protein [Geosporobacter ferrireducens]AOT72361.1 hypothetical protein Gferi_24115 [Geosporobacter ferrireducens]MTI56383.1 hypothetical protein [Geosporobacter ferrireducens]
MAKYRELPYTKLKKVCNPKQFSFKTTEELIPLEGIIGQNRAVQAMAFGLQVKNLRYNIFVVGIKGTGKKSYVQKVVEQKAHQENTPDDWCYVYNFQEPSHPIALSMPSGMGKILCEDMNLLVQDLLTEIPKAFSGDDYERQKTEIVKKYQEERNQLLEQLTEYSRENDFMIKNTSTGFMLAPMLDGEVVGDKEFEDLAEEQKEMIEKKAEYVQLKAVEILRKMKALERDAKRQIRELESRIGLFVVEPLLDELYDKYKAHSRILEYLKNVQNDVIENIDDFDLSEDEQTEVLTRKSENSFVKKYKVNIFVDNSNAEGAPVIIESNPNYNNLVGRIEYENEQGTLKTDFLMVKPGAIHRANGGYLILQANQILSNFQSWDTLKRTLETGEISVESIRSQLGIVDIASLKPEPIPVNIKVIMIGNPYLYRLLHSVYRSIFINVKKPPTQYGRF